MGVTVRQKIKGKGNPWWVFVAHNNRRISRMVGEKKAAEDVANKIQARLALGEFDIDEEKRANEEKAEPTFKEYADLWISTTAPATCKEATVRGYEDLLRLHIFPAFGTLKLTEINRGKIKDFFASKTLDGYAKSTMRNMKNAISGILGKAVDDEIIPTNLSYGIKLARKPKNGNGEGEDEIIDPLTVEETNLFLKIAEEHFPKHYPLCLLLLRTGMRIGEALALKWADIDFNGRFIHVQRGLSRMKIQTPKNGKTRRVDMSQQLTETLMAYRTECKRKGLMLGVGELPEYVFTNTKGGFIDVNSWRPRVFWKILQKAGLRRIRVHDCRHTYATLRISKGDNITDVSNQLGHFSIKLTLDTYTHWTPGGKKSEVDELDNLKSPEDERKQTATEG